MPKRKFQATRPRRKLATAKDVKDKMLIKLNREVKMELKLGQKVRDKITGVEGITTARTEFLNGCVQYEITRKLKKGERLTAESIQGISVDSQQLEVIEPKKKSVKKSSNGGPMRIKTFRKDCRLL